MAENHIDTNADEPVDVQGKSWWTLPFDNTTSFSILGYIFGNRHDKDGARKIDLILK